LNKLKRTFSNLFNDDTKSSSENRRVYSYSNSSNSNNLRKEINEMKLEISKLQKEENTLENNLNKDFNTITQTIDSEKSLIKGLYKREIIAGIMGGVAVAICVILFYVFNGMIKGKLKPYK